MDKVIEIKSLSFTYPDGHLGLDGVDLDIRIGENVAVIGPNGAGKSTLLLHLNGVLRSNGSVKICGLKMDEKNVKSHLQNGKRNLKICLEKRNETQ